MAGRQRSAGGLNRTDDLRGAIDVALLPVSGWGRSVGAGHLDPARAAKAAGLIAPGVAIPIHWGTYAVPSQARRRADMERPAREFAALTSRRAPAVEVRVLVPGEGTVAQSAAGCDYRKRAANGR